MNGKVNRYKSTERWRKADTGAYLSPCGRFGAYKEADGMWRLCRLRWVAGASVADLDGSSTHLTLADCQEIAERRSESVLP